MHAIENLSGKNDSAAGMDVSHSVWLHAPPPLHHVLCDMLAGSSTCCELLLYWHSQHFYRSAHGELVLFHTGDMKTHGSVSVLLSTWSHRPFKRHSPGP